MNSKSQYWIDIAQYDIDTAQAMVETKRYLYVGFMCHQTIEKALKAIIAKDEAVTPPKIHDLIKLSKQGNIYAMMSEEQKDFLEVLLPLNIESRYPSYKDEIAKSFNNDKCQGFIDGTGDLLCWIKQKL